MHKKLNINKIKLFRLYIIKKYPLQKVAKLLHCHYSTIVRYLKKFNIKMRNMSEAQKLNKIHKGKNNYFYGKSFSGENSPNWKQGIKIMGNGYIGLRQSKGIYILRSRIEMEKFLCRKLSKEEIVHHKDENKKNDNIENLFLCKNNSEHQKVHKLAYSYLVHIGKINNYLNWFLKNKKEILK